jgi:predicted RecB family nuclease
MRLSKSKFTQGLGCHRALWWAVHEPDAHERVVGPELQAIFDQGTRVGELARAHVPGGHLVDFPYTESEKRIEATRRAIAGGARVLYEAAFREDDVFGAVDILHRARGRRGWTLTEVKSTTKVKSEHVPDAAVQMHVLQRAGLPITRVEVMHLNRGCRYPDLSNLFTRSDVTEVVEEYLPTVPREVKAQLVMLRRSKPPAVEPGAHCSAPYECPFMERCWPPEPEHAISTLCHVTASRREALADEGYETIFDLPDDVELNPTADRQRRAVQNDQIVVEDGLRAVLDGLEAPIAHLDFETINPAIPVWDGCRPYDSVPVQFSVHVEPRRSGSPLRHFEWLAQGSGDPRAPLAHALVEALRGAKTIIVYFAPFETSRLRELAEAVPELAGELEDIIGRVVDLLPIVREHVYHPDFGGRFSLKRVAPALVKGLRYDELEIGEGGEASRALEALLLRPEEQTKAERARTRRALLAYCEQDTLATFGVLRRLRALGRHGAGL